MAWRDCYPMCRIPRCNLDNWLVGSLDHRGLWFRPTTWPKFAFPHLRAGEVDAQLSRYFMGATLATKSPQPDEECHIRFFFFSFSFSSPPPPSIFSPLPPPATRSSPSPAGKDRILGQNGRGTTGSRPGKCRIPASRLGSGRSGREGPDPVQLRLSPSPSLFAIADRKRKEEE
jgi:hypothetical protein